MAKAGEKKAKEKDIRQEFNNFLNEIFTKARYIYHSGRDSPVRFTEKDLRSLEDIGRAALARGGREKKDGSISGVTAEKIPYSEMKKWVVASLQNLKDKDQRFLYTENAVVLAMRLYDIFESSNTPAELSQNLNKWVVG